MKHRTTAAMMLAVAFAAMVCHFASVGMETGTRLVVPPSRSISRISNRSGSTWRSAASVLSFGHFRAQIPIDHIHPLQRRPRRVIPHRACVSRWPASSPSSPNRSQGRNRSPSQGRFHAMVTIRKDRDCPRTEKSKRQ